MCWSRKQTHIHGVGQSQWPHVKWKLNFNFGATLKPASLWSDNSCPSMAGGFCKCEHMRWKCKYSVWKAVEQVNVGLLKCEDWKNIMWCSHIETSHSLTKTRLFPLNRQPTCMVDLSFTCLWNHLQYLGHNKIHEGYSSLYKKTNLLSYNTLMGGVFGPVGII